MKKVIYKLFLAFIFTFLYAPIFILIINSFNSSKSRAVWSGFTFKWYKTLIQNHAILQAAENTLIIAMVSSLIAAILGTIACVGLVNSQKFFQAFLINLKDF